MNFPKSLVCLLAILQFSVVCEAQNLFIGQDEDAIYNYFHLQKNDECRTYRNLPKPIGFTQYIDIFELKGLKTPIDNGAGSNCVKCVLDDVCLKEYYKNMPFDMAIGIWMNDAPRLQSLIKGVYDKNIIELAEFMQAYPKSKFYLRIGYEFDGNWNNAYEDRRRYIVAFQRIHDLIRVSFEKKKITKNWFAVWQSAASPLDDIIENKFENIGDWYPGDKFVDLIGLSWFFAGSKIAPKHQNSTNPNFKRTQRGLANEVVYYASTKNKPLMICEAAPMGYDLSKLVRKNIGLDWDGKAGEKEVKLTARQIWDEWYKPFFEFTTRFKNEIKIIAYINQNWSEQPMWKTPQSNIFWGDSRIQTNDQISIWFAGEQ